MQVGRRLETTRELQKRVLQAFAHGKGYPYPIHHRMCGRNRMNKLPAKLVIYEDVNSWTVQSLSNQSPMTSN